MNKNRNTHLVVIGIIIALIIISMIFILSPNHGLTEAQAKELIDNNWNASTASNNDQPQYLELLDQLASYSIQEISREDNYYVVNVTVSAPDVKQYFIDNSVHLIENVDDLDSFIYDSIKASTIEDTDAEVYIYEANGVMKVSYSEQFADAMHGKLISYSNEMLQQLYLDFYAEGSAGGQ